LIEVYNKSKIFFNNDDISQWLIRVNEFKTNFIQISEPGAIDLIITFKGKGGLSGLLGR